MLGNGGPNLRKAWARYFDDDDDDGDDDDDLGVTHWSFNGLRTGKTILNRDLSS